MPSHVLYVDDSGQKEYAQPGQAYGTEVSRYFVFGGILMRTDAAGEMIEAVRSLKVARFGREDVEVKSNWLRIPDERRSRYLEPFGLSEEELTKFVTELYQIVSDSELLLLACVVDKPHMEAAYPVPWRAPAAAYEFLMQRVQNELRPPEQTVGVVMDDMMGKTPAGREYRENLISHHAKLQVHGSPIIGMPPMRSLVGRLNLVHSHLSHALQLADLVAYNVFRQFRQHGEQWEQLGLPRLPTYSWFRRILPKFRRGPGGRIQGYGVVKCPVGTKVEWRIKEPRL